MWEDYMLLGSNNFGKLNEQVNEKLALGYELHGSPIIDQCYIGIDEDGEPKTRVMMAQAVVKYKQQLETK